MNSIDALPPMAPDEASTGTVSRSSRAKIALYAPWWRSNDLSRPASSMSKE